MPWPPCISWWTRLSWPSPSRYRTGLPGMWCWTRSLRPYPSLALFSIPVIMLEPIKPVAAHLAATGQMVGSVVILIVGELLKLVLIERLFSLTRDKLMKIPAFAWAYTELGEAKTWRNNPTKQG